MKSIWQIHGIGKRLSSCKNLLSGFKWKAHYDEDNYLESEISDDETFLRTIRKHHDRKVIVKIPQKETVYYKIKGLVWVGEINS